MAATYTQGSSEGRSWASSSRPKGRGKRSLDADHARNIPCRNIQIYGYCKHEKDGCMYNHDAMKTSTPSSHADNLKRRLNVESPSFTPSLPDSNGSPKANIISPKAASAAPFTPKTAKAGLATPPVAMTRNQSSEWSNSEIPEFVPQNYQHSHQPPMNEPSGSLSDSFNFDGATGFSEGDAAATSLNPYAHDASTSAAAAAFFQSPSAFSQPLQYHLYAPVGPHREHLLAYQKTVHDFFIAENLRQDFQRRAEATLQTLPSSHLPPSIEYFHSLVPLDTSNQKSMSSFGYSSWVYKATSSKDGNTYVLRRIENFRVTNDKDFGSVKAWKRLTNASVVTILDCFTTRAFGDSSLVFVTDYHPLSKTIAEQHFTTFYNPRQRSAQTLIPEQTLWGYLVQLASALKAIHGAGLAARIISPTKVVVTNKNRIRLNCCGILDVVQPTQATLSAQQLDDLRHVGRLMLALATNNPNASPSTKSLEAVSRNYSERFKLSISNLMDASPNNPATKDIGAFMASVADQAFEVLDNTLHYEDAITSDLHRELESSRLFRLVAKLGLINERPEYSDMSQNGSQWSETGERYFLKLFRDFVFHQVNADGRPVVDLGHVISCLNKLDAGSEEKIVLTSRDEQNAFVVSYREVKRGIEAAFQELMKTPRRL